MEKREPSCSVAGEVNWCSCYWCSGQESACQCKRCRFYPWVVKIPWVGNDYLLQKSCLENPLDRGSWWAIVQRVAGLPGALHFSLGGHPMWQLQGMEGGELRQHILTSPSAIKAGRYGREALLSHPLKAGTSGTPLKKTRIIPSPTLLSEVKELNTMEHTHTLWKTVWEFFSKKWKIELPYDPTILLSIYQKKMKILIWKDLSIPVLTAALFYNSQDMEATQMSINEW